MKKQQGGGGGGSGQFRNHMKENRFFLGISIISILRKYMSMILNLLFSTVFESTNIRTQFLILND